MSDRDPVGSRQQSDVLGAIFDAVEDKPDPRAASGASSPFRAKALEQIDVPQQIDNLLPLTSRRTWLVLVAVALAVLAGAVYAVGTVRVESIAASGRSVAYPGLISVTAPRDMQVESVAATQGASVAEDQQLVSGTDGSGAPVAVTAPSAGVVWQVLAESGGNAAAGELLLTVVPAGSDGEVLFAVPESQAGALSSGLEVVIRDTRGVQYEGRVLEVGTAPVPASVAAQRLGVPIGGAEPFVVVVAGAQPAPPLGSAVTGEFILSRSTLAQEWLSIR